MNSLFEINNQLAVVTGGGTGLGFAIAKTFIEAGAKVIITGRRENVIRKAVGILGPQSDYLVHDISDLPSIPGLVDKIEKKYGEINILVNNAGVNQKKELFNVTDTDFQHIIQTNLSGVFSLTREVCRNMVKCKQGSIIMITSMAALYGIPNVNAYTAAKSAVLGMTRSLAVDLSPKGVRVNSIAPGFIDSPMLRKAFDEDADRKLKVLSRTPMNKLGNPEDIALAALYLASDASKFVTGINLPVDGGNSIGF